MLRKQIIPRPPVEAASLEGQIPVAEVATVQVTSEQASHPVDNVFDNRRGPGGSRWVADQPGEQTLVLVFDSPQTIRQVSLEVEELSVSRTQELSVSVSSDRGRTYRELLRQEFTFSPPHALIAGTTDSGKTETVKSILIALMTTHTPDELKIAIVDPHADYGAFENEAHLAGPIARTAEEIEQLLTWAGNVLAHRMTENIRDAWRLVIAIEEAEASRESERRDGRSGLHTPCGERDHRGRDGEEADRTHIHRGEDSIPLVLRRQAPRCSVLLPREYCTASVRP